MGDAKPMATLSSTLLARKGTAKPAMRPQGFASFGYGGSHQQDDLGWNDMGHDPGPLPLPVAHPTADIVALVPAVPHLTSDPVEPQLMPEPVAPEVPAVVRQQEELARELVIGRTTERPVTISAAPSAASMIRAAPGSKGKAAFTLRLDPDRHLRLRLSCAVAHRSAQSIVVEALDAFLDKQSAVTDLARTAAATTEG